MGVDPGVSSPAPREQLPSTRKGLFDTDSEVNVLSPCSVLGSICGLDRNHQGLVSALRDHRGKNSWVHIVGYRQMTPQGLSTLDVSASVLQPLPTWLCPHHSTEATFAKSNNDLLTCQN